MRGLAPLSHPKPPSTIEMIVLNVLVGLIRELIEELRKNTQSLRSLQRELGQRD